jgi:hypothetical protein
VQVKSKKSGEQPGLFFYWLSVIYYLTRDEVMSIEVYERQQSLIELYAKLAEAEAEIANGDIGEDFFEVARKLRGSIHAKI